MRDRALVVLGVLLSGCLAPPSADPEALATDERAPDAPVVDETLRVSWTLDRDVNAGSRWLTIRIDAPVRWPAPRCSMQDIMARPLPGIPSATGGWSEDTVAVERDGHYECAHSIPHDAGGVLFTVSRPDADHERIRIHGPHVEKVQDAARAQRQADFERFDLGVSPDGLPSVDGQVPPTLANLATPDLGGAFPSANMTHAYLEIEVIPLGYTVTMGDWAPLEWPTPVTLAARIDVPGKIRWAEAEFDADYREDAYLLTAVAIASNDVALAVSEPAVRGYGACAEGVCFVRDG